MSVQGSLRCLVVAATCLGVPLAFARDEACDSERISVHLDYARHAIAIGDFPAAKAHADLVLLPNAIQVYVSSTGRGSESDKRVLRVLQQAFMSWESLVDSQISFQTVADPKLADVSVSFVSELKTKGRLAGGIARWKRCVHRLPDNSLRYSLKANLTLRLDDPNGDEISDAALTSICMHEVGHLLGLNDSSKLGDLMGPIDLRNPTIMPKQHELDTVFSLRREALDLQRMSELRAIESAAKYNW